MLNTPWHGLLANTAIVAVFVSIWTNARFVGVGRSRFLREVGFGLLCGLGAIAVMLLPFELEEGVFIDLRRTMVAISGFFGGPVSALVAVVMAGGFRLHMGGAGISAGLVGILIAAFVGVGGRFLRKQDEPSILAVFVFAVALAASGMFGLLALPSASWATIAPLTLLPMATIVFVATLMASLAIMNELHRRETSRRNHMYRVLIDSLPDCLNIKDADGRFVIANPATARLMKAGDPEALIGKTDFDFYPAEVARDFRADEEQALQGGETRVVEQQVAFQDGSGGWLSTLKSPLHDDEGHVIGLITHNRDVTDQKRLEQALADSQFKATAALTSMADGLVMFDKDLNVVFCNEQYRAMFPLTADLRVPGTQAASILYASIARGELVGIPTENVTEWVNTAMSRLREPGTVQFQLFDGRWLESRTRPAPDGTCFVACSDITKTKQDEIALRQLNERLSQLAETDGLTGLLNRRAFDTVLAEELSRVGRSDGALSLLLVDVDRFKAFNDTYGHTVGDECLKAVATCLQAVARRPADKAARYGGEEMALILPNTMEDGAVTLAHEFRNRLRALEISHVGSEKGIVTASIGVATLQSGGTIEAARFIGRADEALYAAKAGGRDLVRSWQPAKPQLIKSEAS